MMNDKELTAAIETLKKDSQRKFKESIDLIVALKDLNLKVPEEQVEIFVQAHKTLGKPKRVCAIVGPEMAEEAKKVFDTAIVLDDNQKIDKKAMKKVAHSHDYFIGQANLMPKIAQGWGRVLGPVGKMPNPKAGCIVPPKALLAPLYAKLQKTIKVSAKKSPNVQVLVGTVDMDVVDVVDNIKTVYSQLVAHLPREKNNVKHVFLKLSMSKPVKIQ